MSDQCAWGLTETAAAIRAGKTSSVEYIRALLAQIDRFDVTVRAWVRLDPERLLAEATASDAAAANCEMLGPLQGVPIGIKDNINTAGVETRAGSSMLAGNVPAEDAAVVSRLLRAGALILGKTAMTVFAAMDPAQTRNPWSYAHTPGGSSSGWAAAVAAQMCPAALGTQTAGSILRPAGYCGVYGLKPTYGAISVQGIIPCAWSMDHAGPIARHIDDIELLFSVLALNIPSPAGAAQETLRIGIPDRYFNVSLDPDVATAFENIVAALSSNGAQISPIALPNEFEALVDAGIIVMYAEMAAYHRNRFAARASEFPPRLAALIEAGLKIGAADYLRAQQVRRIETGALEKVLADVTVLLTPTTPASAPEGLDSTGEWRFNLPFSASGHPALTVPLGFSRTGMPIGLQMVAAHNREDRLFRVARVIQSFTRLGARQAPSAMQATVDA